MCVFVSCCVSVCTARNISIKISMGSSVYTCKRSVYTCVCPCVYMYCLSVCVPICLLCTVAELCVFPTQSTQRERKPSLHEESEVEPAMQHCCCHHRGGTTLYYSSATSCYCYGGEGMEERKKGDGGEEERMGGEGGGEERGGGEGRGEERRGGEARAGRGRASEAE